MTEVKTESETQAKPKAKPKWADSAEPPPVQAGLTSKAASPVTASAAAAPPPAPVEAWRGKNEQSESSYTYDDDDDDDGDNDDDDDEDPGRNQRTSVPRAHQELPAAESRSGRKGSRARSRSASDREREDRELQDEQLATLTQQVSYLTHAVHNMAAASTAATTGILQPKTYASVGR